MDLKFFRSLKDPYSTWVAMGAFPSANVWCSAHEIPFEKRVPGTMCIDRRVSTSDFLDKRSWNAIAPKFLKNILKMVLNASFWSRKCCQEV